MSKTNSDPPGMVYPTKQGMLAGNPQDAALKQTQITSNKAASLNKAIGGSRRKRSKRGAGVEAPQYSNMQYTSTNGANDQPNAQISSMTSTSMQGAANSALDKGAFKGGFRKRRATKKTRRIRRKSYGSKCARSTKHKKTKKRGGKMTNPDWNWKCRS
jgi:hypothetical protein